MAERRQGTRLISATRNGDCASGHGRFLGQFPDLDGPPVITIRVHRRKVGAIQTLDPKLR